MIKKSQTFFSQALGKEGRYEVSIPPGDGPFHTLYFIHGLGDDEKTPFERSQLKELSLSYGVMVVTPDVGASWCVNDPRPGNSMWEDFLAIDLIKDVEDNYPAIRNRENRSIAGFSMGGYGAMMMALKHPDLFEAAVIYSGSFQFGHAYRADRPERSAFMKAVAPPGGDYDLYSLAEKVDPDTLPRLLLEVGFDDHLYNSNIEFQRKLNAQVINHVFNKMEGSHLWRWVDSRLEGGFRFLYE